MGSTPQRHRRALRVPQAASGSQSERACRGPRLRSDSEEAPDDERGKAQARKAPRVEDSTPSNGAQSFAPGFQRKIESRNTGGGGALGFAGVPRPEGLCGEYPGVASSSPGCGGLGGRVRENSLTGGLRFSSKSGGGGGGRYTLAVHEVSPRIPRAQPRNLPGSVVSLGYPSAPTSTTYVRQPLAVHSVTTTLVPAGSGCPVVFTKPSDC